jgi:1,4-dihydroxy-2-naphthoyl-CoA hydrolase
MTRKGAGPDAERSFSLTPTFSRREKAASLSRRERDKGEEGRGRAKSTAFAHPTFCRRNRKAFAIVNKKAARKGAGAKRRASEAATEIHRVMQGGMARALGIRLTSVSRRRVTAEMPVTPVHLNVNGRVNGGAIMAFADALGAVGAVENRPPGYRGGTIESKTNFFASGRGPVLTATCVALHVGRTTSVWQTSVKNADGSLVAMVTQTQIALPARNDDDGGDESGAAPAAMPVRARRRR